MNCEFGRNGNGNGGNGKPFPTQSEIRRDAVIQKGQPELDRRRRARKPPQPLERKKRK